MLPDTFIQEVKNSVDMLELASRYTDLKKVGTNTYAGKCPKHKDQNPSFTVFTNTNSWCCYGCHYGNKSEKFKNYGSDCFAFLQWISDGKMTWYQSVMKLAHEHGIPVPNDESWELYYVQKALCDGYAANMKSNTIYYQYLKDRGLNDESIKEWKIGWNGKICFPLFDKHGRTLGFTRRWLNPPVWCRDKYRNSKTSEIFNKSFFFYGIHKLNNELDYLYITEGTIDVILAHQYGLKNVVATLGTSITDNHIEVIKLLNKRPILILDGDEAGKKAIQKTAERFAEHGIYCEVVFLPEGKDLADVANEKKFSLESYINSIKTTYGFYKIQSITNRFLSEMNRLKLQLLPELKDILETIPQNEKFVINSFVNSYLKLNVEELIT